MSAFIVNDDTINGLLAYIAADAADSRSYKRAPQVLQEAGFRLDRKGLAGLASELHRLNVYGVDARYGEGQGREMTGRPFKYRQVANPGPVQAVKSLQCLIYQCAEGDVPERPLFKVLEQLERAILATIVERLPEYSKAAWS